jgi:hypothetical protein
MSRVFLAVPPLRWGWIVTSAGHLVHRAVTRAEVNWPRSVLIKICANKKIGEERRGDYPEAGINLEYEGKTNLK